MKDKFEKLIKCHCRLHWKIDEEMGLLKWWEFKQGHPNMTLYCDGYFLTKEQIEKNYYPGLTEKQKKQIEQWVMENNTPPEEYEE